MSLVDFGVFLATTTDVVRLIVLPVFAWIAWKDIQTRRVPNRVWFPLLTIGVVLLGWDAWVAFSSSEWVFFLAPVSIGFFIVIPTAFLLWRIGGFGGADAKAIMTLAVVFPTYPAYYFGSDVYPVIESTIGSFSFTILANAVVIALLVPVALLVVNIVRGNRSPVMFFGWVLPVDTVTDTPGKLLETEDGFTRSGLDLDVLRMYLRWRGVTLLEVRSDPDVYRHPATIPQNTFDATDGAVATNDDQVPQRAADTTQHQRQNSSGSESDIDWWGTETFLTEVPHAYGVSEQELREGLEVLMKKDSVWVSPGTPFMVSIFLGLIVSLSYGNIIFSVMRILGIA